LHAGELSVSYPAQPIRSPVSVHGITARRRVTNSTYWRAREVSDEITSPAQYIPEVAGRRCAAVRAGATSLSATGGGVSTLYTTSPKLAEGVPGIPTTPGRYVPDWLSTHRPNCPATLFCRDTSDWNTSQQASCNSGFRDSATQDLTIAVAQLATPVFAGMVPFSTRPGLRIRPGSHHPTLYTLASTPRPMQRVSRRAAGSNNECPSASAANYAALPVKVAMPPRRAMTLSQVLAQ